MDNKLTIFGEYFNHNSMISKYLEDLKKIIIDTNVPLEGNCFYTHYSLNLYPELYSKQINYIVSSIVI